MRISLVPDIPDELVARRVKDLVQGHGEFHDAQTGAQMSAGYRNNIDEFLPQLVRKLVQ